MYVSVSFYTIRTTLSVPLLFDTRQQLNYAVALLPIDDAQANVPQNPEFAEVALINAEIRANNAQTEGIISTGDRRRIQRFINAERKALAKRSN